MQPDLPQGQSKTLPGPPGSLQRQGSELIIQLMQLYGGSGLQQVQKLLSLTLGAWWAVRNLDLQLNTEAKGEGMDSEFEVNWKIAPERYPCPNPWDL